MTKGTIVLTPFPFTDLSSAKIRPAVVVSSSRKLGEIGKVSPPIMKELDKRLKIIFDL